MAIDASNPCEFQYVHLVSPVTLPFSFIMWLPVVDVIALSSLCSGQSIGKAFVVQFCCNLLKQSEIIFPIHNTGTLYAKQFNIINIGGCLIWERSSQVALCHLQTSTKWCLFWILAFLCFLAGYVSLGFACCFLASPSATQHKWEMRTIQQWEERWHVVTSLLPHLANVVELPLLIKVRREPLWTVCMLLVELSIIMRGLRLCWRTYSRQKAFDCQDCQEVSL